MNAADLILQTTAIDFPALKKSAYLCARGVRWKRSTIDYLNSINFRTEDLSRRIKTGKYSTSPYKHFSITEPKPRKISCSSLEDRITQRALCEECVYKQLTSHLEYNNCACQVYKGTHFAIARMGVMLKDYYLLYGTHSGYVLSIDVRKFFDNISHGEVKWIISERIPNPIYRDMLYNVIDTAKVPEILESTRIDDAGIPLGSQLSQLFALNALDSIDKYIVKQLHIAHYIRYMDDLRILFPDLSTLRLFTRLIIGRMECMGYESNKKTSISRLEDGITFLHVRYILTRSGRVLKRLEKNKFAVERRKLTRLFKNLRFSNSGVTLAIILRHYQGWRSGVVQRVGEYAVADMDQIFSHLLQTRDPRFEIGLSDLEGLEKSFIRKFCLSAIKTKREYALINPLLQYANTRRN